MDRSSATIYLAEQRGITQANQSYRSWHTFNYGDYQNPHREAPGALRAFNEDTLAGGQCMSHRCDQQSQVCLMPLVGGIRVHFSGKYWLVEAGEMFVLPLQANEVYQIGNPYASELVSYLHILMQDYEMEEPTLIPFDLSSKANQLLPLFDASNQLSIGQFGGRVDAEHTLQSAENDAFVFVIDGVFEVQNRLLHRRDALLLPMPGTLEFEALSEGAILLVLEIKKASLGIETGQSALKYD